MTVASKDALSEALSASYAGFSCSEAAASSAAVILAGSILFLISASSVAGSSTGSFSRALTCFSRAITGSVPILDSLSMKLR